MTVRGTRGDRIDRIDGPSETERRSWERLRDVRLWRQVQRELHLSDRQVQVAILLVRGRTLSEMSQELGISRWTVVTHLDHLKDRVGQRDRCRLVMTLMARSGLLLGP